MTKTKKGSFTLPGESGYEKLTLKLADRWGADVIRDSDGTELSKEITEAGYGIYSTICIIRDHNEWARVHPEQLQQTFLITEPRTALERTLVIHLMEDFFKEQFKINDSREAKKYWQVFDRTTGKELPALLWTYDGETGNVVITETAAFHQYTVSFFAYRIWEEISMYNHVTNGWEKEHLMPIDPRYKETRDYLYEWLKLWCQVHEKTTVVRFTSLFYNFTWIWGSSPRKTSIFSDWGSYDFTVSPRALEEFKEEYGYALSAEDFVNGGKYHVTHIPPGKHQLDYMDFINRFVVGVGKELVDLVHSYGKKAYVFYDDSWIGVEPYNPRFKEFDFDGLIKCVFSGYEARLCAGAETKVHELRLHPYLFPVGLNGAPTFCQGGDPVKDTKEYWVHVRRALLREKIDRIGLGGYLHLVEEYPDFCSCMEKIADEFREIKAFHEEGEVYTLPVKVSVLHAWGRLRSWTLSGHFHETSMHDLIHINEALSGLPVSVEFISFEDIIEGALDRTDIVINAGAEGTAWSGGRNWLDEKVTDQIGRFVYQGGTFIGVKEPSAVEGSHTFFRLAHILGVDKDKGERVCHGRFTYEVAPLKGVIPKGAGIRGEEGIYLTDPKTRVLAEENGIPVLTIHQFGKGTGIYVSRFEVSPENTRMLLNLMLLGKKLDQKQKYLPDNPKLECAWYPNSHKLVVINNSDSSQQGKIDTELGLVTVTMEGFETKVIHLQAEKD